MDWKSKTEASQNFQKWGKKLNVILKYRLSVCQFTEMPLKIKTQWKDKSDQEDKKTPVE